MNAERRFTSFVVRHRGLTCLIIGLLPLILAACTNGVTNGSGY
jgi:hypothetical protein